MKKLLFVMLIFWVRLVRAETYVFVSYSMPDNALKAYFKEAQELGATLVMRGLKDDSFILSSTKSQELGITYDITNKLHIKLHAYISKQNEHAFWSFLIALSVTHSKVARGGQGESSPRH